MQQVIEFDSSAKGQLPIDVRATIQRKLKSLNHWLDSKSEFYSRICEFSVTRRLVIRVNLVSLCVSVAANGNRAAAYYICSFNPLCRLLSISHEQIRKETERRQVMIFFDYYFNVSSTNLEQSKLCVNGPLHIDARLLWKQVIGGNCHNKLTMKLSKYLCLECSTCAMFLSSSFTVSIMALFLSKSLSEKLINAPFMLLFNLVISCIPSTKSL